jgi:hypothetical protein
MTKRLTLSDIEEQESESLSALHTLGQSGNHQAAKDHLTALERIRKTRHGELHQDKMRELADQPVDLAYYLATLGQTVAEVADRVGRKLKPQEVKAWKQGQADRLLEARAMELQWMRRGDLKKLPRWATKVHPDG